MPLSLNRLARLGNSHKANEEVTLSSRDLHSSMCELATVGEHFSGLGADRLLERAKVCPPSAKVDLLLREEDCKGQIASVAMRSQLSLCALDVGVVLDKEDLLGEEERRGEERRGEEWREEEKRGEERGRG